ncbi:MAG: TetR family transcriptional regulator [Gaiellaceae bacterium]
MPQLSSDRIVTTARDLADREGLDAVTLRRLAKELGVHVTSLYNHVSTRDAIVDGIIALLVSDADLPEHPRNWEEWVREFVDAVGAIAAAHPGAFAALERRPVQGERATAAFEVGLAAFAKAGLSPAEAYSALKATAHVALAIGLERALATRGETPETAIDLLPADRFPHVRAMHDVDDPEDSWAFSVETLVAGLHAQIRRAKRHPS